MGAGGGVGGDEEVAEDVVEAGDDDGVAGEFGVLGAGDGCGEEGVDVFLLHVHKAVKFALGEAADADAGFLYFEGMVGMQFGYAG